MKKFLITYKLKNSTKDYSGLYEAIKGLSGYWWHYLDATWIIKNTNLTAPQIFEILKPHVDLTQDYILILPVETDVRSGWLPHDAWTWLNG